MLAAEDVPVEVIGRFVDRSVATVRGWLRGWRESRLASVVTGHAGNENAARLTSTQKEKVRKRWLRRRPNRVFLRNSGMFRH